MISAASSKLRANVWEASQTLLLCANLAWTTLCLGGYLAGTMVVTSVLTAALVVVHGFATFSSPRRPHPAGCWLAPFLVYAAANVAWVTPVRWLGWIDWFNWAQALVVFWVVLNGVRSRWSQTILFGTLLVLGVIAVWLACYQRFVRPEWLMLGRTQAEQYGARSSGPFGIPNSLGAFLLLLIPGVGALAVRRSASVAARILFGWLLLVFLLGLGLTVSRGAWLGLAFALIVWPAFAVRVRSARRVRIALGLAAAVAVTGFVTYRASPLVRDRFTQLGRDMGERSRPILWRAAWQMVRERPLVGVGAGSFNVRFEKYRPEGFLPQPVWAHNDYLNTLGDYGALGFVLLFGAVTVVVVASLRAALPDTDVAPGGEPSARFRRRHWLDDSLVRQGLGIGLLAFALQLFVDFHFKIPALAMACAALAGLLVSRAWPQVSPPTPGRQPWLPASAVALGLIIAIGITPLYRGEALRFAAREAMDRMARQPVADSIVRTRLVVVRQQLDRAVEVAPGNGQAWADRSYALAQWSRLEPASAAALGRQAEEDANRAIACSRIVAEFWIRRGVARDIQGRWADAGVDFGHAVVLSPTAVLPWYHYAYHMSLRPTGLDMADAMVAYCLRLDPANPEVQRLRQRLATSRSGL